MEDSKEVSASINNEVVHGIPGNKIVKEGDIISIDIGAYYKGYHGDAAKTHAVGVISEDNRKLIEVTRQSFYEGIKFAKSDTDFRTSHTQYKHMLKRMAFQ